MNDFTEDIRFLLVFARDDIKNKYAGSRLGIMWAFFMPAITIVMYWFVFQVGFGSQPVNGVPYIIWLASGLIAWFMLSDGISVSITSLLEYRYLVKHVVFNIRIIPIVKVIGVIFVQLFLVLFMLVICALMGYYPDLITLQLFYYISYAFVLVTGISYFLSAANVFLRDIAQMVGVALQFIFWFTPIVWNVDTMPQVVKNISQFNPFFFIVRGYRDTFVNDTPFWEYGLFNVFFWVIALVVFVFGKAFFERCQDHFADVI